MEKGEREALRNETLGRKREWLETMAISWHAQIPQVARLRPLASPVQETITGFRGREQLSCF